MYGRQMFVALIMIAAMGACGVPDEPAAPSGPDRPDTPGVTPTEPGVTAQPPQPIDPGLRETRWTLVSLNGSPPLAGSNITLSFENGQMGGYAGCNWYGGQYPVANEGRLAISEMAGTTRGCADQRVQEQEAAYLQALRQAARYAVRGDRLEIIDAAGGTALVFALRPRRAMNPADLAGTEWTLQSLNGAALLPGSTISITFTVDEARGSAGCRSYLSTYAAEGDSIRFPSTGMLELDCMKPRAFLEQEGRYTDSLTGATDYLLSAERLEITSVEGVLVFVPLSPGEVPPPAQTVWTLQHFVQAGTSTPVLPATTITLAFDGDTLREQGLVAGSSGCNTYTAPYTYVNEFSFSAPAATEMACAEPQGSMEQEQRYLEWLQDVTAYGLDDDELRLETADGRALVFSTAR